MCTAIRRAIDEVGTNSTPGIPATPGTYYVVVAVAADEDKDELIIQRKRPTCNEYAIVDVPHIERITSINHVIDKSMTLFSSHLPAAKNGTIDIFVLLPPKLLDDNECWKRDANGKRALSATGRARLLVGIKHGDCVVCAGRSDGWCEIAARDDVRITSGELIVRNSDCLEVSSCIFFFIKNFLV